ncbi:MAG TPA: hypothetical protein VMG62_00755 [Solirubrobacteraceae bacterium]|nr:hypothetical protein [Solirubrobacteraceae bacterium]
MSVSAEVKRTLVKSPPELWAELSDPAALARHLGELGEIAIVRTEPEQVVDWEAAHASGTVRIEASGWGTRVTLTAVRTPQAEASSPEPPHHGPVDEMETMETAQEVAFEPVTQTGALPSIEEPETVEEAEPAGAAEPESPTGPDVEPRRGFFAKLFRRGSRTPERELILAAPETTPEEPRTTAAAAEVTSEEPEAKMEPEPEAKIEPEPEAVAKTDESQEPANERVDLGDELGRLEEETAAVLVGVLDRLGAAHHRPFSRA